MDESTDKYAAGMEKGQVYGEQMVSKLLAAAQPGAVFGQPVVSGDYTIITASEVAAGGGFGSAFGTGPSGSSGAASASESSRGERPSGGGGGGAGGGGGSSGRPVAAIIIGPEGVRVQPIFDLTKIAIAGITAWGAMALALSKMRRGGGD